MNILQQEDLIKGTPDDLLVQEAQNPSGAVPQFLVISEIQRRKDMRQRFEAEEEQPQQTVAEQIVSEAVPPQGIAALSPQMPPQAPAGAMPPQMPPEMMPSPQMPPQMPPEMMAAQMAPAAPQPQQAMMAGGGQIPNAIIEDAAKFSPESLYDVGPMQQSAMANATNMGIPSVLPMAGGGVVRMQEGEQVPERGLVESAMDMGGEGWDWLVDRYTDEDGTTNWSKVASHAATAGLVFAGPAGWAVRGGMGALRYLPSAYKGIRALAAKETRERAVPIISRHIQRRFGRPIKSFYERHPWWVRGTGIYGLQAAERDMFPFGGSDRERGDVIRQVESDQAVAQANRRENADSILFGDIERKNSGGVVRMQAIGQVPGLMTVSDADFAIRNRGYQPPPWLGEIEGTLSVDDTTRLREYLSTVDPRTPISSDAGFQIGSGTDADTVADVAGNIISPITPTRAATPTGSVWDEDLGQRIPTFSPGTTTDITPEEPSEDQDGADGLLRPIAPQGSVASFNENLIDMLTERTTEIKELLDTKTPLPDYEALRASITEGVDDDVAASILTSIGKSIYEGKGLAGADVSQAQAIRQKARDATSALELAKAQGASAKEVADLDRRVNAYAAMLSAIPSPMRPVNPLTGMTQLQKLHYYRDTLAEGEDREAVENLITRMTDQSIQDILVELLVKQGGIESYDPVTNTIKTVIGMEALAPGEQVMWNAAKGIGALDQLINERVAASLGTP